MTREWFESWFASPYYQYLYSHRDSGEAQRFIDRLLHHIALPPGSRIIDLACGTGRHSIYLASLGYQVTGIDLSAVHIREASRHEKPGLHFVQADMRDFDVPAPAEAVLNLFTSFGYFSNPADHERVLERVFRHLAPGGWFVLDYLNPAKVRSTLIPADRKEREGILFDIRREIDRDTVVKSIRVDDHGKVFHFEERVRLFDRNVLLGMLMDAGFAQPACFGDYELGTFRPDDSDRMIFVTRKP